MIIPFFMLVNKVEICFHGMSRSGNHAVLDWLKSMYPGKVDYWNNVAELPVKLWFQKKSLLIRSHENRSLAEIFNHPLEQRHDLYFGKSGKRLNVLLLRDPFNLFASRLQQVKNQGLEESNGFILGHPKYKYSAHKPEQFVSIWKEHAREYLDMTSYLGSHKVTINYNKWFLDTGYRQKIAEALELPYSDQNINRVVGAEINQAGAGSSFDKFAYAGKATEMKVLERWKKMKDNPYYCTLFQDPEIWELSTKIFGELSETECLRV